MDGVMKAPELPSNEPQRLKELASFEVLDTDPERNFDEIVDLVSKLLDVPIALVSLVDEDRQWFKAKVGLDAEQTGRDISFCGHVVADGQPLIVEDASADERFFDNPLVTGDPKIRFYAGQPLRTRDGSILGTLCAIDSQPKQLNSLQQEILRVLCNQAADQLQLRREVLARQRLSALLQQSPDLIFASRRDFAPIYINPVTEELASDRAKLEQTIEGFFASRSANALRRLAQVAFEKGDAHGELAIANGNTEVPVDVRVKFIDSPGGGALAFYCRDLTERKEIERLRVKLALQERS